MELVAVTRKTPPALLDEAVRLEKKIFPKHESMAETFVKEALKIAKSVVLIVDVERKGAIALYERAGFIVQSMREDYYQPGRHAFVMQRSLQGE